MNEHLHVGEQFFRIIDEFENAPPDCRQTASGAALDAYLCPSEQWTIGDGCCFWETGEPVKEGDSIPDGPDVEKRLEKLLAYNARYCEEYVREHVTVQLNQHQFDALCSFRFNTRETTLRNSSRLLPAINNQEWQKAALAMTEFVYGLSTYNGKPYQEAMEGILRRRLWESLIFLSYDPVGAVTVKGTALPTTIKLMSSGVYRDVISSEGLTTLNQVRMRAQPLPPLELTLTTKADPVAIPAAGKAGQPAPVPNPAPAAPAPKPAAPVSGPAAGPASSPKSPQGQVAAPVPVPAKPALPTDVGAKPPVTIPPSVQVSTQSDMGPTTRTMWVSKRFWGGVLIIAGRLIIVADIGGHFAPAVKSFIGDGILMDWMTGVIVTMIGELVLDRGEKKATGPMDTPKRIALTTPTP